MTRCQLHANRRQYLHSDRLPRLPSAPFLFVGWSSHCTLDPPVDWLTLLAFQMFGWFSVDVRRKDWLGQGAGLT